MLSSSGEIVAAETIVIDAGGTFSRQIQVRDALSGLRVVETSGGTRYLEGTAPASLTEADYAPAGSYLVDQRVVGATTYHVFDAIDYTSNPAGVAL